MDIPGVSYLSFLGKFCTNLFIIDAKSLKFIKCSNAVQRANSKGSATQVAIRKLFNKFLIIFKI